MAKSPYDPPIEPSLSHDGSVSKPPNLDGGAQPKSRMFDARQSLQMITRRAADLANKWGVWQEVMRKYDCEPPDTPEYMRVNGMGHATNVCWGSMEARADEITETYYNLASGGRTFLSFHSRRKDALSVQQLNLLADEHKIMWDGWEGRQEMLEQLVFNRSLFPFSAIYYDNPDGWYCKALHPENLIFQKGAGINCDTWFWCAIKTSFEAWQLIEKLEDADASKNAKWKTENIRKACQLFCKDGTTLLASIAPGATWGSVPYNTLQPHDLAFNDQIPCFVFYVKEWSGKVSEHILVNHQEVGYIYSYPEKHEKLSAVLRVFPHGLGGGLLENVRSYGVKTLHYHDALDRLTNSEYDTALITSSLLLQTSGTQVDKMSELIFNVGGITTLPDGFAPAQVSFRDSAAGIRLLKQDLRGQLNRNVPSLAGDVDLGDYEKSTKEAAMKYQTQLQLGLFKVDRFRTQMNGFAATHWARILGCLKGPDTNGGEEAKEFFKLCAIQGVTPDVLMSIFRVTHKTGSARGNRVNEQLGMDRAVRYFGMFSEDGKRAFAERDIELALDEQEDAKIWLAKAPGDGATEQARLAMLENSTMASGLPVINAGTDWDGVHLDLHTNYVAEEIEKCKAGKGDPRVCFTILSLEIPHADGHMTRLASDRAYEAQLKEKAQEWSQFENYRRQLEAQLAKQNQKAQQAAAEAARTPQIDPKDQQALAFGQLEMGQKQQKHEQEMTHAQEEHDLKMREGERVPTEA